MRNFQKSERDKLKKTKDVVANQIKNLQRDEERIGRKTSALAILYKKRCLVDKSKSDAVKIYLTYQIELAKTEDRQKDVQELEKESVRLINPNTNR